MRDAHDGLAGADHLARLRERVDDDAVRVRHEQRIAGRVARDVVLRLGRAQLRCRRVRGGLQLLVRGGRHGACRDEVAVAGLVVGRLARAGAGGRDGLGLRTRLQAEVDGIDAHQGLPPADGLADVDEALHHLARHAKAQVALDPGADDAGE